MLPSSYMQPNGTDGPASGAFDGPPHLPMSLSAPSLPGAATPCNSRMGTPAPGAANQRTPSLASLLHLPLHVQQQYHTTWPPKARTSNMHI